MQNYYLLDEVGRCRKPVMLKRGFSATIEEWLLAAEYILAQGNPNVMLCERGIRTFERSDAQHGGYQRGAAGQAALASAGDRGPEPGHGQAVAGGESSRWRRWRREPTA